MYFFYLCSKAELNREQLMPETNDYGLFLNAADKIRLVVEKKLQQNKIKLSQTKALRVNLRGDATLVGRSHKFLNFCFNLPDEGLF